MINLIILLLLLVSFIAGKRKGFLRQVIQLIGFLTAFVVAFVFSEILGTALSSLFPFPKGEDAIQTFLFGVFSVKEWFYRVVAFFLLFFVTNIVFRIISNVFHTLVKWPILNGINQLFGGIVGFIQTYLFLFIILFIASVIPNENVMTMLQHSFVATMMLEHTPILSNLTNEWFQDIERSFL